MKKKTSRRFVFHGLPTFLGIVPYNFLGQPVVSADSQVLLPSVFITTYFVGHYQVTVKGKQLASGTFKYGVWIPMPSCPITLVGSITAPFLQGLRVQAELQVISEVSFLGLGFAKSAVSQS